MEDPDSESLPVAMEACASIPSRITGIGEREIQQLIGDLEGLSGSIGELKQGLEQICAPLVAVSEIEDPSIMAKCWTKQVRKLCHDTGDYLYDVMHSGDEFKLLGSRALNATARHAWYEVQPEGPSKAMARRLPVPHADLISHRDLVVEVAKLMDSDDKELRVVSIVGPEGVGKTTLAKSIYHQYQSIGGSTPLECRAFVRASPKPDIRRLLTSMFMQIQRKRPSCGLSVQQLIHSIAKYLRNTRYFIIIDDLWSAAAWEIISRAFPDGHCGSRIITTTQMKGVAFGCCGHQSKYVYDMVPLSVVESRKLFFRIVFGSESDCPGDLVEVSEWIIRKCGGLPLATINIASMLPSALNLEQWTGIRDSLPSTRSENRTSEWMKEVVNLLFSTLRPHLKTCLLYFSMYPEGYIVRKDDLIKQWVVEGVLDGILGQATEEAAVDYFDELVRRGMIQPVDTEKNGRVLSCTLHRIIHDVIVKKSMEENFVIIADHFQSAIPLPDKVRRLSVQFGGARSAYIPDSIMVSEVRSLAFFGYLQCFLSASTVKFRHVRVLILHIWADEDKDAFDLTGIRELLRLRYLKVSCNIGVKLPDEIQGQQYLETLEVHATAVAIPWDIGGLTRLSSLNIAVRELLSNDIILLQILPALTALSVHVKTAPTKTIVIDEGGFLNLRFFTFRCSAPRLLIEESAFPKIEKLDLCFNAQEGYQDGTRPITIEHLTTLKEISAKIGGTVADVDSALADAISNHANNPIPVVQLMESTREKEHATLEEEDEIMEEDVQDNNETQDDNKHADSRISMLTGSSWHLPVPVGWGLATAGWILSPIFTRLVDKALTHMEPGESKDSLSKLVTDIIPRLKFTVEETECIEDKVFFEELVRELKTNFYELEEILDEIEYDRLERQLACAVSPNQGVTIESSMKSRLTENLKKIEQALEESRDNMKLEKLPRNRRTTPRTLEVKDGHKTTPGEPRVKVIGQDEHVKKITQFLRDTTKDNPSFVIGIYGIAGSGKTTLAQTVYRSEKNANHFDILMWIHVSRDYSVGDIMREMLLQVIGNANTNTGNFSRYEYSPDKSFVTVRKTLDTQDVSLQAMRAALKESFRGKKFLLVLDDIWCDKDSDKYKLYELFSLLPHDAYGKSRILITSQNRNAISVIGLDVEYANIEIPDMSENDFFNLFLNHALRRKVMDLSVKESLKEIGAEIARRLKGSPPLAAALVGGVLQKEMTVDHWRSVKDDPYLLKGITGVMWLCYQQLDEQARRCFAYCGMFSRRHRFERDELVKLWVAEGFIEATDERQMEDIANYYFGELVSTSFMQLGEKDCNRGKEYFLVHDLLHDMAEQVGGDDFFRIEDGWSGEVPLDVRHLFVQTSYRFLMKDVVKLETLRSLIIINGKNSIGSEVIVNIFENKTRLRKLRVLLVETACTIPDGWNTYSFPASIGDLKHIRYLAFRWEFGQTIDLLDGLRKLYHLQFLDFGDNENLCVNGYGLFKLINLRHLMMKGVLVCIDRLTRLESISCLRIGIARFGYSTQICQLSGLDKLRGKLQIAGLENVESMEEALEARLANKEELGELVLRWDIVGYHMGEVQEAVLEGLCPSEHLEELQIIRYRGRRYPDWMLGYNNRRPWCVQRLVLQDCTPPRAIPSSSQSFFANLVRITFQDCHWHALPHHMEHLQKLIALIIHRCQKIEWLPELPRSLKYLEICNCESLVYRLKIGDWEKIQHIERKFIGYPRLQDSSQHPDEHGVFFSDASFASVCEKISYNKISYNDIEEYDNWESFMLYQENNEKP